MFHQEKKNPDPAASTILPPRPLALLSLELQGKDISGFPHPSKPHILHWCTTALSKYKNSFFLKQYKCCHYFLSVETHGQTGWLARSSRAWLALWLQWKKERGKIYTPPPPSHANPDIQHCGFRGTWLSFTVTDIQH